jgi:hypothetical protein
MLPCPLKCNHTSFGMSLGDHYKTFSWLPSVCTYPLMFHRWSNYPWNSSNPILCLLDPRSKPPCSPPLSLPMIPAYISLPLTTIWHVQNWYLPLTRSGHAHTWLMVAHVHPGWSLQELILNMIQVTYPIKGLLVTPRYSLKLSITPDSFQIGHPNPTTMLLQKDYSSSLMCNSPIIKIRPWTNPIPKVMLSITYPETHPITRSTRNNKEGYTDTRSNLNACNYLK